MTPLDEAVRRAVSQRIEQFDQTYSRFRDDSLVARLREPTRQQFPVDAVKLFGLYATLYDLTEGKVTPLVGGQLEDAGYDQRYSFLPQPIRSVGGFATLRWDGKRTLDPSEPVSLDVGAAGKGCLVDIVAELLDEHGVYEYTVDASGDVRRKGGTVEVIGLEHPADASRVVGVAHLKTGSLCASAVTRRAWGEGMHHVFDPIARRPVQTKVATWVVADDAMVADGLATALFFVEPLVLLSRFDFTYVTIGLDGTVDCSPDFDGELFI